MATDADRVPAAEGLKVIESVQLAATASEVPQVFVWLKSAALVPVTARLLLREAGFSWRGIANEMGGTRTTVRRVYRRLRNGCC